MHRRPWFIVILALFHWFSPIGNIVFSAFLYQLDLLQAFEAALFHSTPVEFFKVFMLMPLAGFAIYAYKRWSYAVFVGLNLLSFYFNFNHWRLASDTFSLSTLFGTYALNLLVVGYFLLPKVRLGYFDPKLRWWEKKPRYAVDVLGEVAIGANSKKCQITDLSETGLFMKSQLPLQLQSRVSVGFQFLNTNFNLKATVAQVRIASVESRTYGFGLKFTGLDEEDQAKLKKVICVLSLMKVTIRTNNNYWLEDFRDWMLSLFTTGKGFLPSYVAPEASVAIKGTSKRMALRTLNKFTRKSPKFKRRAKSSESRSPSKAA